MSQGVTTVDNMDDGEELQVTDVSTQHGWGKTGKLWGPAGTATSTGWVGDRGGGDTQSHQEAAWILPWRFLGFAAGIFPKAVVASSFSLQS